MSDAIRFKRGPKSNLSVLGLGEPGLTTDANDQRLYIGGPSGNIPIPNMNDLNAKINKTQIIEDLNTTEDGYVLGGKQGKILLDLINNIYIAKKYPNFVNGKADIIVNGVTTNSVAIIQSVHGNGFYVHKVECSENKITVTLNNLETNGVVSLNMLVKIK